MTRKCDYAILLLAKLSEALSVFAHPHKARLRWRFCRPSDLTPNLTDCGKPLELYTQQWHRIGYSGACDVRDHEDSETRMWCPGLTPLATDRQPWCSKIAWSVWLLSLISAEHKFKYISRLEHLLVGCMLKILLSYYLCELGIGAGNGFL